MPQPNWIDAGYDPTEAPDRDLEILGRGKRNRATKTFFKDSELATVAAGLAAHIEQVESCLRVTHANHFTREVKTETEDGEILSEIVPEVLEHDEIRERYPILKKMERFHAEQLEHYTSIHGFSISSIFGRDKPEKTRKRGDEEGSTGADAPER